MRSFITLFIFFGFIASGNGQQVEGFDFTKYSAKPFEYKKKAKLQITSNPEARKYATSILEKYESSALGFAAYYVPIILSCSQDGCIKGFLVDVRNGKIYTMPISKANTNNNCLDENNIFDRYLFLVDSRLLITSTCHVAKDKSTKEPSIVQTFYVHLWNEKTKQFTLIKKLNKTTKKE